MKIVTPRYHVMTDKLVFKGMILFFCLYFQQYADAGELNGYFYLGSVAAYTAESSQDFIDSLDKDLSHDTKVVPATYFEFRYTISKSEHTWFFRNNDLELFQAGLTRNMVFGNFDFSIYYQMPEDVWKNPYDTTGMRQSTKLFQYGGGITWNLKNGFSIDYTYMEISIENDTTAAIADLGRDGGEHTVSLSFSTDMWHLGCLFSNQSTKGSADSNIGFGMNGSYTKVFSDHFLVKFNSEAIKLFYRSAHPVFQRRREDINLNVNTLFKIRIKNNIFSLCYLEYSRTNCNIDFLDENESIFAAAFGIEF